MKPVPIRRGATRPQGRQRHALGAVLARLGAVAGLAFAGWLVLSALTHAAQAAQGDDAERGGLTAKVSRSVADVSSRAKGLPAGDAAGTVTGGMVTGGMVTGGVRALGEDPMAYLESRGREVLDDKAGAVRAVRGLAAATGVPRLRVPDVPSDGPIGGLVGDVTAPHHALDNGIDDSVVPQAHVPVRFKAPGHTPRKPAKAHVAHRSGHASLAPARSMDMVKASDGADGDRCAHCRGEHRLPGVPGPGLPSGQDEPRSGALSGGHPFGPIADLRSAQHLATPPALGPATFPRTAPADTAAPGDPAVVPD